MVGFPVVKHAISAQKYPTCSRRILSPLSRSVKRAIATVHSIYADGNSLKYNLKFQLLTSAGGHFLPGGLVDAFFIHARVKSSSWNTETVEISGVGGGRGGRGSGRLVQQHGVKQSLRNVKNT